MTGTRGPVIDPHEEWLDAAAAHALQALDAPGRARMDAHVRTCPICARRVDEHRRVLAALPYALPVEEPPASLRASILGHARSTARPRTASAPRAEPGRRTSAPPRPLGHSRLAPRGLGGGRPRHRHARPLERRAAPAARQDGGAARDRAAGPASGRTRRRAGGHRHARGERPAVRHGRRAEGRAGRGRPSRARVRPRLPALVRAARRTADQRRTLQRERPGRGDRLGREPLAYFYRTGPLGQLFAAYRGPHARRSVAVVGLGAGSIGCHAEPGQRWTFYEIDPAVVRIAQDTRYFTFLRDCVPGAPIVLGDARLRLTGARAESTTC